MDGTSGSIAVAMSGLGLLLNVLALLTIAWRGGQLVGSVNGTIQTLSNEVTILRTTRDAHVGLLAQVVEQLDGIESRVAVVERTLSGEHHHHRRTDDQRTRG